MRSILALATAITCLCAIAVKFSNDEGTHAYLEVTLQNHTGSEIDETAVIFGKHRCTAGVLGSGARKTHLGWQRPVGTNAVVEWRDPRSVQRKAEVSLLGVYDREAPGNLVFTINPTNVIVQFQKKPR